MKLILETELRSVRKLVLQLLPLTRRRIVVLQSSPGRAKRERIAVDEELWLSAENIRSLLVLQLMPILLLSCSASVLLAYSACFPERQLVPLFMR